MVFDGPTGAGYSYQWFLGDGSKSNAATFSHTYKMSGSYQARLIVISDKGCSSESSQSVSVTPTGNHSEMGEIEVYPNPSSGNVQLNLTAMPVEIYQVSIRDLQGKVLKELNVQGGTVHTLDLSDLAPATYLLDVSSSGTLYSVRISLVH